MKTVFKESHVGQEVNCSMFGNGVIETINLQHRYPVKVLFQGEHYQIGYLQDGRHDSLHYPTLSFGHKEMGNFQYGTPKPMYRPLNFDGTPVMCYVGADEERVLERAAERQVIAANGETYLCINYGIKNTKIVETSLYNCAMPCSELDLE